jgi:hypothetical protein
LVALKTRHLGWFGLSALILSLASPVSAQLGEQLSSYTGRNAPGYLEPLVDAFGADMNAGLYHSARIPKRGLYVGVELVYMSAWFSDADRTFTAVTELGFQPEQRVEAPTVVGSGDPVYVDGYAETEYVFPGGFEISSFDFAVPQFRVGADLGTEAVFRLGYIDPGEEDIGNVTLYGVGARHSVSQYFNDLPIDVAVGGFWQRFSLGNSERGGQQVTAEAWTMGVQLSRCFSWLEPYAGVSYDDFVLRLAYEGATADDSIGMTLESNDHFHATLGLSINISSMVIHGEYNIGGHSALALGAAVAFHPLR